MRREMNSLFKNFLSNRSLANDSGDEDAENQNKNAKRDLQRLEEEKRVQPHSCFPRAFLHPRVDISESETTIFIDAELPGLTKEQVHVELDDDNNLNISGEIEKASREENQQYVSPFRLHSISVFFSTFIVVFFFEQ